MVPGRHPGRRGGVQQPGAVHVGGKAVLARHFHDRPQRLDRPHRPAPEVCGLLDREQPGAGRIAVGGVAHRRPRLLPGVYPPFAVERRDHHPAQGRRRSSFEVDDMRGAVGDDLVPRGAVDPDGDLVAHRPGGEEHRGLLAEEVRHHLAQAVHARVLQALLVADRRSGHRLAHGPGGEGLGVAVEVDHGSASDCPGHPRGACERLDERPAAHPGAAQGHGRRPLSERRSRRLRREPGAHRPSRGTRGVVEAPTIPPGRREVSGEPFRS